MSEGENSDNEPGNYNQVQDDDFLSPPASTDANNNFLDPQNESNDFITQVTTLPSAPAIRPLQPESHAISDDLITQDSGYFHGQTDLVHPDEWRNIPNDPSVYSRFWSSSEAFQNYQANSQEVNKFNSIYFAIGFLVNLLVCIILMFVCISNSPKASIKQTGSGVSLTIFVAFLVVVLVLLFVLANQYFYPVVFLDYGIWIAIFFNIFCVFFFMFFKIFYWFGVMVPIAIVAMFFWFYSRDEKDYNRRILSALNSFIFKKGVVFSLFIIALFIMSAILVLAIYTSMGAKGIGWHNFSQIYLMISLWYTINVFCNCFYMMSSYMMAKEYFQPGSLSCGDIISAGKRAFVYNIGVASKAALILPFTDWIRNIGISTPKSHSLDLVKPAAIFVSCMHAFMGGVQILCEKLNVFIGSLLDYPSRRALAYVAMFGIEYKDACARYAEVCSNRHSDIVDKKYNGELIWRFRTFNDVILTLVIAIVLGPSTYDIGIGYTRGLFVGYGLFLATRSILRGAAESLFVCFGEAPNKADNIEKGLTDEFKRIFSNIMTSGDYTTSTHLLSADDAQQA